VVSEPGTDTRTAASRVQSKASDTQRKGQGPRWVEAERQRTKAEKSEGESRGEIC
jgi:hypothetical protein